jgi:hypothetical protein
LKTFWSKRRQKVFKLLSRYSDRIGNRFASSIARATASPRDARSSNILKSSTVTLAFFRLAISAPVNKYHCRTRRPRSRQFRHVRPSRPPLR